MNCHEFARVSNNGDPKHLSPDAREHLSSCAVCAAQRDRASSAAAAAGSGWRRRDVLKSGLSAVLAARRRPSTVRSDEIGVAAAQCPGRIHRRRLRRGRRASRVQTRAGRPQGRALRGRRRRLPVQRKRSAICRAGHGRPVDSMGLLGPALRGHEPAAQGHQIRARQRPRQYRRRLVPAGRCGRWMHDSLGADLDVPERFGLGQHRTADRRFELELGPHAHVFRARRELHLRAEVGGQSLSTRLFRLAAVFGGRFVDVRQ